MEIRRVITHALVALELDHDDASLAGIDDLTVSLISEDPPLEILQHSPSAGQKSVVTVKSINKKITYIVYCTPVTCADHVVHGMTVVLFGIASGIDPVDLLPKRLRRQYLSCLAHALLLRHLRYVHEIFLQIERIRIEQRRSEVKIQNTHQLSRAVEITVVDFALEVLHRDLASGNDLHIRESGSDLIVEFGCINRVNTYGNTQLERVFHALGDGDNIFLVTLVIVLELGVHGIDLALAELVIEVPEVP